MDFKNGKAEAGFPASAFKNVLRSLDSGKEYHDVLENAVPR
jgi:hypothetical protein